MPDTICDPKTRNAADKLLVKMGGPEGSQSIETYCRANDEGRFGTALLNAAKLTFHDIPKYQFSSGTETPKPAATPVVKSQDAPVPHK